MSPESRIPIRERANPRSSPFIRGPEIRVREIAFAGPIAPDFQGQNPSLQGGGGPYSPAPMILAAIDWLTISIDLLIGVFVLVCLIMSLIILMQRPKNEGLGAAFGSGTTDQLFGARTTNVLQRGTVYLATLFFVIALALSILIGQKNKSATNVKETAEEEVQPVPAGEEPAKPAGEEPPAESEFPVTPPAEETPETPAEEPQPEEQTEPAPLPAEEERPEETPPAEEPPAEEPPAEEP